MVIRADILSSDRVPYLIENKNPSVCPVCASGLDIKHTDVLILSQFVRRDGCMLPRRVTGLCKKQQKRVGTLVTMAHKAGKYFISDLLYVLTKYLGLMPNLKPDNSHKDPKKRYQWKQHNKYFDESTIKIK